MDEDDVAGLNMMNSRRNSDQLTKFSVDHFELFLDRLVKESYFHVQTIGISQYSIPVICCLCMDSEAANKTVIQFCDLCNLATFHLSIINA